MNIASLASVAGRITTKQIFEGASKRLDSKLALGNPSGPATKEVAVPSSQPEVSAPPKGHRGPLGGGGNESRMDLFMRAFGATKGDEAYRADFDFDADGEIGPSDFDLLATLRGMDRPAVTLEEFQKAFGTAKDDEGYNANADLDRDGEVGPNDFALLSEQMNASRSKGGAAFAAFEKAFGATKEDGGYSAFFDFDRDGEIGATDFSTLSNALGVLYG